MWRRCLLGKAKLLKSMDFRSVFTVFRNPGETNLHFAPGSEAKKNGAYFCFPEEKQPAKPRRGSTVKKLPLVLSKVAAGFTSNWRRFYSKPAAVFLRSAVVFPRLAFAG